MARLLIIDDHDSMREGMAGALGTQGHDIVAARSGAEGLASFQKRRAELVITDLKMDAMDGLEVVRRIKALEPSAVVMVVTAFGTIEAAVEAMTLGASDFITKPFPPEVLRAKVEKALELSAARTQLEKAQARADALEGDRALERGTLVGKSEPMRKLGAQLRKAAATDATVLIQGESGTGKELVARALHDLSPRAAKPFVVVHCAALAEGLLESELFGHERGAFTGAVKRKLGRFELADGGTLFLDEIGEIAASIQTKLLRVLQEKTFERVGAEESLSVDVRLISATNRDLRAEVSAGRFREDLFYRLHVLPLAIPPLRERGEDLAELCDHFIRKSGARLNPKVRGITAAALDVIQRHAWPGNVRELENAIEQALVFCEGERIDLGDLPEFLRPAAAATRAQGLPAPDGRKALPEVLDELERSLIIQALEKAQGVKAEAARLLGIKTSALYYKLEKYGLAAKGEASEN